MGALFRQGKRFTMMWKRFRNATNNTMELRAAAEAVKYLPAGMNVWVTMDSQYVRKGVLEWMSKWKTNGWKHSKKQGIANAVFWRELDAAIARHTRVEFDWAKAHSGILLNKCTDQLASRAVNGTTYFPGPMIETPPGEVESSEEFVMRDEDVTRCDEWDDDEHTAPGTIRVRSVGLATEEE
jgi:ribonuclease HI